MKLQWAETTHQQMSTLADHRPDMGVILISGAILLLAIATLVVRYASFTFPSGQSDTRR